MARGSTYEIMQPDGTLRCKRCGGTQFQPKHSTGKKVMFGFAALLSSTNEIRCLGCGYRYLVYRGPMPTFATPPRPDVG